MRTTFIFHSFALQLRELLGFLYIAGLRSEVQGQDSEGTPMDDMIKSVRLQGLSRPKY